MNQILIIQTASLGDVILSTALAESLHQRFPDAALDFLIKKGYEGLFNGHPFVRNVLIWDKQTAKYRELIRLIHRLRKTRYDLVINVQRFFSSGLITTLSAAKETSGFDKNPFAFAFSHKTKHLIGTLDSGGHETERNHLLIDWIDGIMPARPRLYPGKNNAVDTSSPVSGNYITISPASLWFTKQYPVRKWIEFVRNIPASTGVIFLGAKDDQAICNRIIAESDNSNTLNLAGKLNFLQSAEIMKHAEMNFVNDSAPMHLASAVNAPVTAIFCSTVPAFGFGPLSDDSAVIEASPEPECRPCGLHGYRQCPQGHFNCAERIRTEQLLSRLKK